MSEETEKLRALYQLLFDLATGRQAMGLEKESVNADEYDDLYKNLYDLGERLRALVLASGTVPPYTIFNHISSYVFVLDASYRLIDFNNQVSERLGYKLKTIRYRLFETLLTSDSAFEWHKHISTDTHTTRFFVVMNLVFLSENGMHLPLYCTVTNALFEDWVFVLSVEVYLEKTHEWLQHTDAGNDDSVIIEQLHHYILSNLDEALPSVKSLALHLGIEEHKLRQGFKAHYHTSIYQFYQQERLKKGYQLILHTRLQLKEIAYQCGFSTYINFYKAFKKKFGIAPSVLLRPLPKSPEPHPKSQCL